jgi:A/G-specific adenine glycosylase
MPIRLPSSSDLVGRYRRSVSGPKPLPPALRDAILTWYAGHGRSLPFRGTTDPYAILVSEAMAQQTQAARAGEAWTAFMTRFPTVETLAAATPADVLRAWRGLGYNRRALDLWRAARRIVEAFGGEVPRDLHALESLPGVGPYTARAVAAIAFGLPVGAVDTNVRRVLGRIVSGRVGEMTPAILQRVADAAVPPDRPGDWTHALMDVGAMLCSPRQPDCGACPARDWCRYAGAPTVAAADTTASRPRTGAMAREIAAPFRTTSRWLRGRILDRLREAPNDEWVVLSDVIGEHDRAAIGIAATALRRDGLIELDLEHPPDLRARLPIT